MAKESGTWLWLKKARLIFRASLHMHRIENSVMAGMPDVEGFLEDGGQFWLELKAEERPKRPTTPVRFAMKKRVAQVEWLKKRWAIGGKAFLLLQVGTGAERKIYLVPGKFSEEVRDGLTEDQLLEIATYCEGGSRLTPDRVIRAACNLLDKN
jgi:hypothetical protein